MYDAYPVSTMTYIEPVGSELLPCSSQFFHAGAEIPFGRYVQQRSAVLVISSHHVLSKAP